MLQVPFASAPEIPFTEEITQAVAGYTILIAPGPAPYNRFIVKELETIDEVRDRFSALKRGILLASLSVGGCGIRIKDDLLVFEDATQLPNEELSQPFACPQGMSLARLVIKVGEPVFQLPLVLPSVTHGLEIGIASNFGVEALQDPRIALACDLYTGSFFEKSFAAQFIALITVLEVLKDRDSVSLEVIRLIDDWLSQIDRLEDVEANSFRGQLERMKQLSISRGIGRMIARHLGEDRAREIQELYGIRSTLVHDGKIPADLENRLQRAQCIVRELLISILRGSRLPS